MKSVEMTVRRALILIKAFEDLDKQYGKEADWSALKLPVWREVFGDVNQTGRELPEMWARWREGTLQRQVLDLAANLNLEDLAPKVRKEVERGLNRIRQTTNS